MLSYSFMTSLKTKGTKHGSSVYDNLNENDVNEETRARTDCHVQECILVTPEEDVQQAEPELTKTFAEIESTKEQIKRCKKALQAMRDNNNEVCCSATTKKTGANWREKKRRRAKKQTIAASSIEVPNYIFEKAKGWGKRTSEPHPS
jgi:hypothetical protein